MVRKLDCRWLFVSFALWLSASVSFSAPGWTIEYIRRTGGVGFGDYTTARAIWDMLDKQGLNVVGGGGNNEIGGRTSFIRDYNATGGQAVVNTGSGGGSFAGIIPLTTYGPGQNFQYTMRARSVLTFPCGGTYTIAVHSDDGRHLQLGPQATVIGSGGQGGANLTVAPNTRIFPFGTGNNRSWLQFTVAPGAVVPITTWMWEGGGGDSFEVSIANGAVNIPQNGAGAVLLSNDAFGDGCVLVDDQFPAPQFKSNGGFSFEAFNLIPGAGIDSGMNNIQEAIDLFDWIDANCFDQGLTDPINGSTYNIANHYDDVVLDEFDILGNNGANFQVNDPLSSFGGPFIGDRYLVRGESDVCIPVGDWTISMQSDDGHYLRIPGITITAMNSLGGITAGGIGNDFYGFTGCCARRSINFTITPAMAGPDGCFETTLEAFYYEGGGGDYGELFIAPGHWDTGGSIGGLNNNRSRLLENGMFCWQVCPRSDSDTACDGLELVGEPAVTGAACGPTEFLYTLTNTSTTHCVSNVVVRSIRCGALEANESGMVTNTLPPGAVLTFSCMSCALPADLCVGGAVEDTASVSARGSVCADPATSSGSVGALPTMSGVIYHDLAANGARDPEDPLVSGVSVTAYDCDNNVVASAVSGECGCYSLVLPSGEDVRVEFGDLPAGFCPAPVGCVIETKQGQVSGQVACFAADEALPCRLDFAVTDCGPAPDCENARMYLPCFSTTGNPAPTEDVTVCFDYGATTIGGAAIGQMNTYVNNFGNLGTVWGTAWAAPQSLLYQSAFIRRGSPIGPLGNGGIYCTDPAAGTVTPIVDLAALGFDTGDCDDRDLGGSRFDVGWDADGYFCVGKGALGDLDVTPDGNTLYTVNLATREIVVIDLTNFHATGAPVTAADVTRFPAPDPGCAAPDDNRPFGLNFWNGSLYLGSVCSAESTQNQADLTYTVFQIDPNSLSSTPILTGLMTNITKGVHNNDPIPNPDCQEWYPWSDDFTQSMVANLIVANEFRCYPQPVLSDIEFGDDGTMYLGFMDRWGAQLLNANSGIPAATPAPFPQTFATRVGQGQFVAAYNDNCTYILEDGGNLIDAAGNIIATGTGLIAPNDGGPGGIPFFDDGVPCCHPDTGAGGLAVLPKSGEVIFSMTDPDDINSAGISYNSQANGAYLGAYTAVDNTTPNAKSSAVGDVEVACPMGDAVTEIGGRLWFDCDKDGIQDPCNGEKDGIAGLTVELYDALGTLIGTTVTDANGQYLFNSVTLPALDPGMIYEVRIPRFQAPISCYRETTANYAGDAANTDLHDSDAVMNAAYYSIPVDLTTCCTDQDADAGFVWAKAPSLACPVNSEVDLGCVYNLNVVPLLIPDMDTSLTNCGAEVFLTNFTEVTTISNCTYTFCRVFTATNPCATNVEDMVSVCTQKYTYSMDLEPPKFARSPQDECIGCVPEGMTPQDYVCSVKPLAVDLANSEVTDGCCLPPACFESNGLKLECGQPGTCDLFAHIGDPLTSPLPGAQPATCDNNFQNADQVEASRVKLGVADGYVLRWSGFIKIPAAGTYTFFTTSDDGSLLYIDGTLVVNNNFCQGPTERSGTATLTEGCHEITVVYAEAGGGDFLSVFWENAAGGIAKAPIPDSALYIECCDDTVVLEPVCAEVSLWCDTYYTNGCEVTVVRKLRAEDGCGNVTMEDIVYTMNCTPPVITSVETGMVLGCQVCDFVIPTNLMAFTATNLVQPAWEILQEDAFGTFGGTLVDTVEIDPANPTNDVECYAGYSGNGGIALGHKPGWSMLQRFGNPPNSADGLRNFFVVPDPLANFTPGCYDVISHRGPQTGPAFGPPAPPPVYPNFPVPGDNSAFATCSTGQYEITTPGVYSFRALADDQTSLWVDGTNLFYDTVWNTWDYGSVNLSAGLHTFEFYTDEGGGGDNAVLQIADMPGTFDRTNFGDADWSLLEAIPSIQQCGTYTKTITPCAGFAAWGILELDATIPPNSFIDYTVSYNDAGTLLSVGPARNVSFLDLSSIPNTVTSVDLEVFFYSGDTRGCVSPVFEGCKAAFLCDDPVTNVLETAQYSITNQYTTNGCEVTLDRTYRVETCCGLFDEQVVTFSYTKLPDLTNGPLAKLDVGCIANTNQIPPVDLTMFAATSSCEVVSISKVGQTAPVQTGCVWSNERVFLVETLCDVTNLVTQSVCWVINNTRPEITEVEKGQDWGCQAEGFVPPMQVTATNHTGDVVVTAMAMTNGCTVMYLRTYRAEDCCGNFDRREVQHSYTLRPGPATVAALADLNLGCVSALGTNGSPRVVEHAGGNVSLLAGSQFFPVSQASDGNTGSQWVTDAPGGGASDYFLSNAAEGDPVLVFDLGADMNLAGLQFWNYNVVGNATKDFELRFATSATGANFTGSAANFCAAFDAAGEDLFFQQNVTARFIEMTVTDNWLQAGPGGDRVGFADIQFVLASGNPAYAGLPSPSALLVNATSTCSVVEIAWADDYYLGTTDCVSSNERLYVATDACGKQVTVRQILRYTIDMEPPRISAVSNYVHYGCVTNEPRSVRNSLAAIVATDDNTCLSTQCVMEVRVNNGCDWTVTRSWRVEDSCGKFDLKDEVYSYTLSGSQELRPLGPYTNFGSATAIDGCCVEVTPATGGQAGASWATEGTLDMLLPWTVSYDVYLGDNEGGADGIAFLLNPGGPVPPGGSGGNLGAFGSGIGVALDTWPSPNDTVYIFNGGPGAPFGNICGGGAGGAAVVPQLEDGQYHAFMVSWDPVTLSMFVSLDGVCVYESVGADLVALMGGVTDVTYGFIGGTGGAVNSQRFCPAGVIVGLPADIQMTCLDDIGISCLSNSNQVPPAVPGLVKATGSCNVAVMWVEDRPHMAVDDCTYEFERVYMAFDECGNTNLCTQTVNYTVDRAPSIAGVPPSEDFGCIAAAPCLPDPWAGVLLENAISSNVTPVATENPDCSITMVRTYQAVNCCGVTASATATYTWTPATPAPTIVGQALVDLGCILDTGNIPVPSVSQFQAVLTNDLYCATDFEDGKFPADWTVVDGNPGSASDPDFQVVMDASGNNILLQANAGLATGGGTSLGGYALLPKTFCSFTACFDLCLNDQSQTFEDAVFVFGDNGAGGNYHVVFSDQRGATDIWEMNGINGGRTIRVNNFTGATTFDFDDDLCYTACISFDDTVRDVIIEIEEVGNPANAFSGTFPLNDTTYGPGQIGFGSYNDAPSFDNIEITGSSDCSDAPQPVPCGATIAFTGSSPTNAIDGCVFEFTNSYEVAGGCSPTGTFDQTIRYTLSLPPEIVSVEKGSNLGCQVAGYVPPMNLDAIVATNAISTNVSDVVMFTACEYMIMRTYRVQNCCGQSDEQVETYTYTPIPDLPTVEPLMDLDLGCIASTNQIPPVDLTMAAVSAVCGVVSIRKISTSAPILVDDCTMAINRCFEVTTVCGISYPPPATSLIQISETFDTDPGWATTDNSGGGNNPAFVVAGGVLSQTTVNPDLGAGSNGHFIPSGFALPPDQFCNMSGCFDFRFDSGGGNQDVTFAFNYQDPQNFYYILFSNSGGRVDLYSVIGGVINAVQAPGLDGLIHSLGTFHPVCIDYNAQTGALNVTAPSAGIAYSNPAFNPGGWTSGQIGFGSLNDDFSIDNVEFAGSTDCAFTLDQLMDPTAIGYCQRITYTLETVPQIVSVPKGTNFGCQAATFRIPPCFTNTTGGVIEGLSLTANCIDDITVGRGALGPITYGAGQLIGVDLTCYQAGGGSEILVPDMVAPPPPGSRATLIEDLCLDTGILNPTTTAPSGMCFTFASPVCNSHGPDIVFFELDPLTGARDPIVVTINGVSVTYGGADYAFVSTPLNVDTHDLAGNPNIGGLETLATSPGNLNLNNQGAHGIAIDLDDFGITGGSCILTMDLAAGSAGERVDPLFIAGLPNEYQDAPVVTGALGIDCSDWYVTNGCDVVVTRVFIATNCCGNFDRREVDYTYTLQPGPATVDALAHLDLGCISGTNNIPSPSAAIVSAMSTCSVTAISWCGDTPAGNTFPAQLEGEDMMLNAPWAVFDDATASGGQYIEVPNSNPGNGDFNGAVGSTACASGTIKVFTPGIYRIVANVRTPAGTDDSFYVRVNGDPAGGYRWFAGNSPSFSTRTVTDTDANAVGPEVEIRLDCGDHLIEVCLREDGAGLDWIGLELVQALPPAGPCDCPEAIVRCYDVTDVCGETIEVNQCITFIEDSQPPRLTVPGFVFFDCVTADPCPAPDASVVSATDDNGVVSTQMIMEVRQLQGCSVIVTRTWRAEDCCGNFDIKDQVYGYSIMPTNFTNVAELDDLDLGCISDAAQVPPPTPLFFSADALGAVGVTPTQTVLSADADAYIQGRTAGGENSNFGGSTELRIKYNLNGAGQGHNFNRKSYIRYDLSPIANLGKLTNAVLCLPFVNGVGILEPGVTYTFAVYGLNDGDPGEGWAEGGITWNNAPQNDPNPGQMGPGTTLLGRFTVFESGAGTTVNFSDPRVLQFIQGDSDGQVSFALVRETQAMGDGALVHIIQSKEGGDGPQLKLGSAVSADLPVNCPVAIEWGGDSIVETTPCTTTVERIYIATNACGIGVTRTQTITYTIDRVPEILMVEKGVDYGCVPANFYPSTNFSNTVWMTTNAVSTNVMDMVMTNGCEVMLRRTYLIRNCCNEFDRREETYNWTVRPDVTALAALGSVDMGCITSTNQIPAPSSFIAEMDTSCGGGQVAWLGDQAITGAVSPPQIEAESMALSGNFVLGFDPVASGGAYIEGAGTGGGTFSAPNANTAEATFAVLTPGTYQLRVWLRTPNNGVPGDTNGNNDSFFYAVDGILGPAPWNSTTSTVAFPDRVVNGTWDLTCGDHTVTIYQREDGTEIDRVALELVAATPAPLCECPEAIMRTYSLTDLCGGQTTVQQTFTYTLDTAPPRIDAVAPYVDYACVTAEPRPLADSLAAIVASDVDGNLFSTNLVQELRLTNGCDVTVTRSWRVEDCCGNFDLRDEVYSYTDTPAITAMPLIPDTDLGCISTTNMIPPPSALLLGGNFACGANITFQDSFLGTDGFCTWTNQRVYSAMDECGGMLSFTQLFTYTLDTGNPLITAVPAFSNYGCVADDPRPLPLIDDVAAVDDGTIVRTQLVMEMRSVIGYEIEVVRTWRVEDCCGNWHEKDSVYRFTPSPTNITVAALPDLDLGCLDDPAQIPQPDPDIVTATVSAGTITNCSFVLLPAMKDSYVWNDQAPGPNLNGGQDWVQVGDITSMLGDSGLKGYLQFDLSGAPFNPLTALSGACLEFSVNTVNPNATGYPACFEVLALPEGDPGEAWTEALLEWANAPYNDTASNNMFLPGLSYVSDFVITNTTSNTTVSLCGTNLANVLTANLDGIVTFLIRGKDPVSAPILIGSRENTGIPDILPPTLNIDSCVETPMVDVPYDVVWTNDMVVSISPNGCTTTVERVYVATEECGLSASVTQTITYLENGSSPEITWVEIGIDWGCQAAGWTPPTNVTASLMATNAISTNITDKLFTTNCTAYVQRTFRVENCCGDFDTRVVVHTYTLQPAAPTVPALADIDLGCIPNASLVPQPNATLVAASSACAIVSIDWVADGPVTATDCLSSFVRTYIVTDLCGSTTTVDQAISYTPDTTDPMFTAVPTGIDFGCPTAGQIAGPALPDVWVGVTGVNFVATNLTESVDTSDPCLTTITRSYTLTDCCGDSESVDVVYTYIPLQAPPTLTGLERIDLGCLADVGQIPVPSTSQFTGSSLCGATISYVGSSTTITTVCSHEFERTYVITDNCGQTNRFVQTISYRIDTDDPKFLVLPGGDLGCAPVQLPSPADDILAMTVTDACDQTTMFVNESSNLVDCTWTLTRNYMAMDGCDNSEVAQVVYTWTLRPPTPTLAPLAAIDAGCVSSPAAVPGPSLALLNATTTCSETLSWVGDGPHDLLPGQVCSWFFERVYQVEDGCGETATTTQMVSYTLESVVQIAAVPPPQDFGCVTAPPVIPTIITTTGNVQSTTFADTVTTNGCRVTLVREWTSTACCGEFDQASQTFNWTETPGAPSLIGPLQIDLGCIADEGQIPQPSTSQFTPVAGCGATVRFVSETPVNIIDNCNRTLSRTYEITDECGQINQAVQTFNWTLNDTPVEITATETGGHLGCLAAAPTNLPPELTSVVIAGNPTGLFVNVTQTNDGCLATLTREYTTRDCCGNFDSATVVWTWDIEQAPPVISGPAAITLGCIPDAGQVPAPSTSQFTVQSACGASIALLSESAPASAGCVTSIERVYQATGNCGETATFSQTITWVLENPPTLNAPADQTFGCASADPAPSLDWTTVTLGGGLIVSSNAFENTTVSGCTATKVLTYSVVGCCGGQVSDSVTYTWTVEPAPPTITGPDRIDLGCLADVGQIPVPNPAAFTVASDCSATASFVTETPLAPNGCTNQLERVYQATDNCGQTSVITQTITWVTDAGPPVITSAPPGGDLGCVPVTVPAPDPSAVVAQDGCRIASISHLADITNRVGCVVNLRRVYRVVDLCNNRTDLDVRYTWTDDSEAPALTPPPGFQASTFLGCNPNIGIANIPPVDLSGWSATDNCGATLPRFFGDEITTNGCAVRVERIFIASDSCGNTSTATQTYRYVLDNAQPTPTLTPGDLDLGCDISGPADIPAPDATIWTADDMCGPIVATNHIGDTTTSIGCETLVTRTFEFTDDCGNTGQASQVLRYRADNAAPTIQCPADEELGCNPQSVPAPNAALAFASDDCGQPTVSHLGDTVTTNGCAIEILRVYQAVDSCGNISSCTQRIAYVEDRDAPTHNAPADVDLGCNPADIPAANFTASDSCSLSTNLVETMDTSGCRVTLTRLWELEDACGNQASHVQTITWTEDLEPPTLLAPPALELGCNPAEVPAPNPAQVQATDNCDLGPVSHVSDTETDDGCAHMILRVFEAADACGNRAVVTQQITWSVSSDTPTLTDAPIGQTLACNAAIPAPDPGAIVAQAGCGNATATLAAVITNQTACMLTVVHEYHITDACGNQLTHQVNWGIPQDSEAPTITCPPSLSLSADALCEARVDDLLSGAFADNCGIVASSQQPPAGTVLGLGNHTITLEAVDACGNATTCSIPVTVMGGCTPDIDIQKTVAAGHGADCATAVESLSHTNGAPITWCLRVENTGTVPLDDVTVRDLPLNYQNTIPGVMQPGDVTWLSIDATLTIDLVNTASVTGEPLNGTPQVSDADPAEVHPVSASIALLKTVAIGDNAQCPAVEMIDRQQGDMVTYCFEVTNTGEIPLTDVSVVDPMLSPSPIPVVGTLLPGQTAVIGVPDMFDGAAITNLAYATGAADTLPSTGGGGAPILATPLDPAIVMPPCGCAGGTVFSDLANDGSSVGDNLANLGIPNVTVELFAGATASGSPIATAISDADGRYKFEPLMSGTYTVRYDESTLPGDFTGMPELTVTLGPCDCVETLDLAAVPSPTAVRLDAFKVHPTATGLLFSWTTGAETDTLGFRVLDADGAAVTPRLVLAGAGQYALHVPGRRAGTYTLEEVTTDLATESLASVQVIDAAPQGPPTETVEAVDGVAQFETAKGVTSYLVIGFAKPPTATTDAGDVLAGALLEVDGDHAIYLSPAAGLRLTVE